MRISHITRRIAPAVVAVAVALTSTLTASPAQATDYEFMDDYYHSSGALAVRLQGEITWHNRSVTLSNVGFFVKSGECGRPFIRGWVSSTLGDIYNPGPICSPVTTAQGTWFYLDDIVLDGSRWSGGINKLEVEAYDYTHGDATDGDHWFNKN